LRRDAGQGFDHAERCHWQQRLALAHAWAKPEGDRHQIFVGVRVQQEAGAPALVGKALVLLCRQGAVEDLPQLRRREGGAVLAVLHVGSG